MNYGMFYLYILLHRSVVSNIAIADVFSQQEKQARPRSISETNETVTLVFVGDINFDGPVRYYVERGLSTYNTSFEHVAKYIREADYAIGNLESPFGTSETRKKPAKVDGKSIYLLAHPESVEALRFAGIDAVTLANNHMNDFGEDAVELTVRTLQSNGIDTFGMNRGNAYAPQVPVIKDIKRIKIGFLGYCNITHADGRTVDLSIRKQFKVGMAIYSDELVRKDVIKLKERKVDVIVVFMHWGSQHKFPSNSYQMRMGEFLTSLGVNLIIGAHPHVIQGHGYYGKSFLTYSIGHFLFGQMGSNYRWFYSLPTREAKKTMTKEMVKMYERKAFQSLSPTKDTLILKVKITRDGSISASYLPCEIQFNVKKRTLQPVPRFESDWIEVCGVHDRLCLHNDKLNETTARKSN